MNEGINNSECARHGGASLVAVIKALKLGRIEKSAGGKIDRDPADADWEANTKPQMHSPSTPLPAHGRPRKQAPMDSHTADSYWANQVIQVVSW